MHAEESRELTRLFDEHPRRLVRNGEALVPVTCGVVDVWKRQRVAFDEAEVCVLGAVPTDTDNGDSSRKFLRDLLDRGSFKVTTGSTGSPEPEGNRTNRERIVKREGASADERCTEVEPSLVSSYGGIRTRTADLR